MVPTKNLYSLTSTLMNEVRNYGILEISLEQYRAVCNKICSFALSQGTDAYSSELMDEYLKYLDHQFQNKSVCFGYHRFQNRVVRMLKSLATNGQVDFSSRMRTFKKYPVSEDIRILIDDILTANNVSQAARRDLLAPTRHLFWYATQEGCHGACLDDIVIMKYLINEVPLTNSGSTGRTLRCVKYVTEYLKSHGIGTLKHDYTMLKLKNAHIRIIPAFSEEEICDISSSTDNSTPLGMRDYAIILLSYGTGLRGADIVNLKLSDIDWKNQKARILQTKTHSPLVVELIGSVMNALADYILSGRPECSVPEVFVTVKAPYRKLTANFGKMVDKYCEKAKVEKIPFRAFHSFRRAFETVLVTNGVPIETVSRMMGHGTIIEDKPYITHNRKQISFVAMDFSDVPIQCGIYARQDSCPKTGGGVVL